VACTENDDGDAVSPEGKPEIAIDTVPPNPLLGVTDTWKVDDVPGAMDGVEGVAMIVNDGEDGGGACAFDPPPPQQMKLRARQTLAQISAVFATQALGPSL
jgi:hypothetical protein